MFLFCFDISILITILSGNILPLSLLKFENYVQTLYKIQGTCSQFIDVTVDEQDVIQEVSFIGGCGGNLQAVCRLVKGQLILQTK